MGATIKAYTDLQQSKKLAEILPLESADMHYWLAWSGGVSKEKRNTPKVGTPNKDAIKTYWCPCWSLSALLILIPQEIFDGEYIINITEGCDNRWALTYDHHENRNHSYYSLSIGADNLVDACYKLILKLNELNLL